MLLIDYLPTRIVELTVHTLDLTDERPRRLLHGDGLDRPGETIKPGGQAGDNNPPRLSLWGEVPVRATPQRNSR